MVPKPGTTIPTAPNELFIPTIHGCDMNIASLFSIRASPAGFQYVAETSFAKLTYASPIALPAAPYPISKKLAAVVPARIGF